MPWLKNAMASRKTFRKGDAMGLFKRARKPNPDEYMWQNPCYRTYGELSVALLTSENGFLNVLTGETYYIDPVFDPEAAAFVKAGLPGLPRRIPENLEVSKGRMSVGAAAHDDVVPARRLCSGSVPLVSALEDMACTPGWGPLTSERASAAWHVEHLGVGVAASFPLEDGTRWSMELEEVDGGFAVHAWRTLGDPATASFDSSGTDWYPTRDAARQGAMCLAAQVSQDLATVQRRPSRAVDGPER